MSTLRVLRLTTTAIGYLAIVAVGSILLFWLGRPVEESRSELIVDPDEVA